MSEINKDKDPLLDLLLDADQVDRARLAKAMKGFIGIDSESGRVVLKSDFNALSARNKVLTYLIGVKVSNLLGKSESEFVAPKDIPAATGLPSGTVYPKLKELKESHIISQNDSSQYYVASHQTLTAVEKLENSRGKKNE